MEACAEPIRVHEGGRERRRHQLLIIFINKGLLKWRSSRTALASQKPRTIRSRSITPVLDHTYRLLLHQAPREQKESRGRLVYHHFRLPSQHSIACPPAPKRDLINPQAAQSSFCFLRSFTYNHHLDPSRLDRAPEIPHPRCRTTRLTLLYQENATVSLPRL